MMAELFGTVASGLGVASLGIQIGQSILKLKEFVDKVKEAPETIQYLIAELEILNSILRELKKSDEEAKELGVDSLALQQCQDLCHRGSTELKDVLEDVQRKIGSRPTIGSLKAVLKVSSVEKLRGRVGEARSLLMFAHMNFST
jgi:hypothetical protein